MEVIGATKRVSSSSARLPVTVHYSKTVIVAVGSGILKPTKLAIEGAERYEVGNLHYTSNTRI